MRYKKPIDFNNVSYHDMCHLMLQLNRIELHVITFVWSDFNLYIMHASYGLQLLLEFTAANYQK
jgi:hypothetical protein